ncbi:MAG: FtsX-like permease family protein, partial [Bacteroidetes bacterium]|nr:FtsX-like permease family protein [Bacteroidota bacterium]
VINPEIALSGSENINIDNSPIPKLMVRVAASKITEALDHMKATWEKVSAGSTWQFSFVDESLAQQYRSDTNLGSIVSVATTLAILIGAMGLYALASLAMQGRTKEISIRKVMGATEESLLILVSKDYLLMVAVCLLLSAPVTILVMNKWLTTFEYRVSIGWSIFAFAGGLAIMIVVIAIGYHTLKAVWSHPADTLKYE